MNMKFNPSQLATCLAVAGLMVVLGSTTVLAEEVNGVQVMRHVPDTYELASALFPKPVRGLVIHQEQPAADSPKIAFMINFEYNSARVLDGSLPYLDSVGKMLSQKNLQNKDLIIEGHADAKGGYTYNLSLSEQRAQAVKRYLVSVHHIDPKRLLCVGKGNTELLNPARPFAPENRRVQFLAWHHE